MSHAWVISNPITVSENPSYDGSYSLAFPDALWSGLDNSSATTAILTETYTPASGASITTTTSLSYSQNTMSLSGKSVGSYSYVARVQGPYANTTAAGDDRQTSVLTVQVLPASQAPTPTPTPIPTPTPTPIPSSTAEIVSIDGNFTLSFPDYVWAGHTAYSSIVLTEAYTDESNNTSSITYPADFLSGDDQPVSITGKAPGEYRYSIKVCGTIVYNGVTQPAGGCTDYPDFAVAEVVVVGTANPSDGIPPSDKFDLSKYDIYYGDFNGDGVNGDIYLHGRDIFVLIHGEISVPILLDGPEGIVFYRHGGGGYYRPFYLQLDKTELGSYTKARLNYDFFGGDVNGDRQQDYLIRGYQSGVPALMLKQTSSGFPAFNTQTFDEFDVSNRSISIALNDYNYDGRADLVRLSGPGGYVTDVIYSNPQGNLEEGYEGDPAPIVNNDIIPDQSYSEPTVPSSDLVGVIPGEIHISGGAAAYSVPIDVPPGRNGAAPSISLEYNSQSGQGIAGYGWSVSASSAITRCASSIALDNTYRAIKLDSNDKLCLDGQRLMLTSGQYGAANSTYVTEKYSGKTIKLYYGIGSSLGYFEVKTNDNKTIYYGSSTSSRYQVGPVNMSWHITVSVDASNNAVAYFYDNSNNELTLSSIKYTGTFEGVGEQTRVVHIVDPDTEEVIHYTETYIATSQTVGDRVIRFDYVDNEYPTTGYIAGKRYASTKQLNKIVILINGVEQDNYSLSLEGSPRKLTKLTRETSDGDIFTQFDWYAASDSFTKTDEITWHPEFDDNPWTTGELDLSLEGNVDLDGDGIFDLIYNRKVFLSSQHANQRYPTATTDWVDLPDATNEGYFNSFGNTFDGRLDSNGDGKADILYVDKDGNVSIGLWESAQTAFAKVDTGIDVSCTMFLHWDPHFPPPKCNSFVADFDQDGISDLLLAKENAPEITMANYFYYKGCLLGSSGCENGFYPGAFVGEFARGLTQPMEVDGDGQLDLMHGKIWGDGNLHWYKFSATTTGGSFIKNTESVGLPNPGDRQQDGRDGKIIWTDPNKDGLTDLLTLATDDDVHYFWYYIKNKGNGSFENAVKTTETEYAKILQESNWQGGLIAAPAGVTFNNFALQFDYDNDGIVDILVPSKVNRQAYCLDETRLPCGLDQDAENYVSAYDEFLWKVVLIKEVDGVLQFEHKPLEGFKSQGMNVFIADVNGDGLTDLSAYAGIESWWYSSGAVPRWGPDYELWVTAHKTFKHYEYRGGLATGMHTWVRDYHNANLLEKITTANGRVTEATLKYKPLSFSHDDGSAIYTPGSDALSFPYIKFTNTMKVITEIDRNNGVGGVSTTRYSFEKAVFHKQGRGFQGFGKISQKDLTTGLVTEESFYQSFPFTGIVSDRKLFDSNTNTLLQHYAVRKKVEKPDSCTDPTLLFPHVRSAETLKYDLATGASLSSEYVTTDYDCRGNLKTKIVATSDATVSHTQRMERFFTSTENCPNLLLREYQYASADYKAYSGSSATTGSTGWTKREFDDWQDCKPKSEGVTASNTLAELNQAYTYDAFGNVTSITTTGGTGLTAIAARVVTTQYDSAGYFPESTYNNQWGSNVKTSITSDARYGKARVIIDENGLSSETLYNKLGQAVQIITPEANGKTTPNVHTVVNWCTSSTCPTNALYKKQQIQAGAPAQIIFIDTLGREIQTQLTGFGGEAISTSKLYSAEGYLIAEYGAQFDGLEASLITYQGYDVLGRPGSKTVQNLPTNYKVSYTYSGLDTAIAIQSTARNFDVARTINALNQLVVTRDANGNKGYFRYDGQGNPVEIIDVAGNSISAGYDGFKNKQWFDDPNMGNWVFTHNALGELKQQIDANNTVTNFQYDLLGRMTSQTTGNQLTSWQYDPADHYGVLDAESRNNGYSRSYHYDVLQRVTGTSTLIDSMTLETATEYDTRYGWQKGKHYPGGEVLQYIYDSNGYLTENRNFLTSQTLRTINDMDAQGNLVAQQFGNGFHQLYNRYEQSGLLDEVCSLTTSALMCDSSGAQYIDYAYDTLGNLGYQQNLKTGVGYSYTYDNLMRLDTATRSAFSLADKFIDYDYDAAGNFLTKSDYASDYIYGNTARNAGGNAGPNAVRQITKLNNITTNYSYDNNGNMLSGDGRSLAYNAANKPIEIIKGAVTSHFSYGADEMRFKQVVSSGATETTTLYVGKLFEKIITKTNNTVVSVLEKSYFDDFAVATRAISGTADVPALVYLHGDRLGSVSTLSDGTRNISNTSVSQLIVQQRDYGPFGAAVDNETQLISDFQGTTRAFTGHEQLPELQLIHMNGRAYDFQLGRFLSVDPFVQTPENTQSANPYSYIMNNPLAGTDPSGYVCNTPGSKICENISDQFERRKRRAENKYRKLKEVASGSEGAGNASSNESAVGEAFKDVVKAYRDIYNMMFTYKKADWGEVYGDAPSGEKDASGFSSLNNGYMALGKTIDDQAADLHAALKEGLKEGAIFVLTDGVGRIVVGAAERAFLVGVAKGVRYGPTNPGALVDDIANSFRSGSYTATTLSETTTLYRVYGGSAGKVGSYWTRVKPSGPLQSQLDSALAPQWGNSAQRVATMKVPKGTTIYEGAAAPQSTGVGQILGGGNQVYIPRVNPKWIQ